LNLGYNNPDAIWQQDGALYFAGIAQPFGAQPKEHLAGALLLCGR
jgi:hypothetical protein